ncbi:erythromycin esterase family protein [Chitinophaga agrisoli]|uniref:Erythromycin esterase family protein n=1 Tax=Chitinophaga agrisoli TaxID=2607653 RepID=A0A5B2VLP2_9BACT|nr:erythromycin esterase family protein [Chitinophaga agrisoli]KAA2239406.1 erythromycin esterase family protein [Chitinophaga agrisoli]
MRRRSNILLILVLSWLAGVSCKQEHHSLTGIITGNSNIIAAISSYPVIMMGEQFHGDANALHEKTTLVKSLVRDHGYEAIVFESGFYDMGLLNGWDPANKKTDLKSGLWPFWADCHEANDLIRFLDETKQRGKLALYGIDCQVVKTPDKEIYNSFLRYTAQNSIDTTRIAFLKRELKHLRILIAKFEWHFDQAQRDSVLQQLRYCLLTRPGDNLQQRFYHRCLQNLYVNLQMVAFPASDTRRLNLRDSMMAANYDWLQANFTGDKKTIIWTANLHTITGYKLAASRQPFISLAQWIRKSRPQQVYTLCLSAYKGRYGSIKDGYDDHTMYFKSSNRSVEYKWAQAARADTYGFIQLKDINDKDPFYHDFASSCNQGSTITAPWRLMADGLIVYPEAKPVTF